MKVLYRPTGITLVFCVVNMTCNTVHLVASIVTDRLLLWFVIISMLGTMILMLAVLLEMLMARDGKIRIQSFCNDEIDLIINDMCTQ